MVIRLNALELEVDEVVWVQWALLLHPLHGSRAPSLEVDIRTEPGRTYTPPLSRLSPKYNILKTYLLQQVGAGDSISSLQAAVRSHSGARWRPVCV